MKLGVILGAIFCIIGLVVGGLGIFNNYGAGRISLIVIGAFSIIFGIFCVLGGMADKAIKDAPLLTAKAKVFAKTTNTSGGGTSYVGDGLHSTDSVTTEHFISFEFNDCRENVKVDVSLYNTVAENEMGMLEYKDLGGLFHFVNFKRDE